MGKTDEQPLRRLDSNQHRDNSGQCLADHNCGQRSPDFYNALRTNMSLFQPGRPKTGGRTKGTRNKLGSVFLEKLLKEFDEHGEEAIRICRVERPHEFLKIVASILPKEFEIV